MINLTWVEIYEYLLCICQTTHDEQYRDLKLRGAKDVQRMNFRKHHQKQNKVRLDPESQRRMELLSQEMLRKQEELSGRKNHTNR